jgi:hypothetical protein
MIFGSVSGQNLCFESECTISGYRSCEASILKRGKTCVSSLNALFQGTKAVMHPFYSIGPKIMFGSVSGHFSNLRHVKDEELVFRT